MKTNRFSDYFKDIKNLKKRLKNEGLVCEQTEKTGKFTIDILQNVVEKMEKHIKDDKVINEKKVRGLENKLNGYMGSWSTFIKLPQWMWRRDALHCKKIVGLIPIRAEMHLTSPLELGSSSRT